LLVFTAQVEHSAAITLNSVTYGGRSMTKIIERSATSAGSSFVAYTAVFTLNESGVAAASNGTFTTAFSATPERPPGFSSVFLVNVNQASPVAASASAVSTGATATTAGLATASGDLVILAATNGNTGSYTVNNGFTEAIELTITSADGVAGSKSATGATETPSVTHSAPVRQSLIGLVIRGAAGGGNLPPTFTNDPFTKPGAVFAPLSEGQVAFGLPASTAAAGSGFTPVQAVQNAVRYLTQRTEYAGRSYTLQKPTGAYPNFRGLMIWNVFHDAANGFEFSANHGPFLRNLP
jgi:hypothetical protein